MKIFQYKMNFTFSLLDKKKIKSINLMCLKYANKLPRIKFMNPSNTAKELVGYKVNTTVFICMSCAMYA